MDGERAAARPECEHYWAHHVHDGLSIRLCQLCHEPDWEDLRGQLVMAAAVERERIRGGLIPLSLEGMAALPAATLAEHAKCCWPGWQEQLKGLAGRLQGEVTVAP